MKQAGPLVADISQTIKSAPSYTTPQQAVTHAPSNSNRRSLLRLRLRLLVHLGTWLLLTGLLFGQIFGVVLTSVTTYGHTFYGQPIEQGLYDIPGLNDEPYTDRAVVCIQTGRIYQPIQLSQLIAQQQQKPQPDPQSYPTNGRDAYRIVTRDSFTMDATKLYTSHCNAIASTITEIFSACEELGYNVTKDVLRVVDGVQSEDVVAIPKTLPVLILPYWDATIYARYVIPSYDGSGCMFRTSGMFEDMTDPTAVLWGVSRVVRENKTATWLGYPGGVWRHGWYEDPVVHMKWYSDVISSLPDGTYGINARRFDLLNRSLELNCTEVRCPGAVWRFQWNDELSAVYDTPWFHSITISNGARFGLFLYEDTVLLTTTGRYSLEGFISNISLAMLLARWLVTMVALYPVDSIGIAAISNAFSFKLLPVFLLPRLRSSLEAFWTVGCVFDGDQAAVENAWFTIYPAIGEVVVFLFSALNIIAKICRRRMSDALLGPTLLIFVLLHALRFDLASWKLFDGDRRVTSIITSQEVEAASVIDFFTTNLAFRTNGRVKTIFYAKLAVLGCNFIPFFFTSRRVLDSTRDDQEMRLGIEKALAIHFDSKAGLGSTARPVYSNNGVIVALREYELARSGYIVVGSHTTIAKLVTVGDWFLLIGLAWLRCILVLPFCITIYDVAFPTDKTSRGGSLDIARVGSSPSVVMVHAMSLKDVNAARISICAFG